MPQRLEVSTDVATFGIWEPADQTGSSTTTLDALTATGRACTIGYGADVSGAVDVFVDEPIPAELLASTTLMSECLLDIRSGSVAIDGAEYFRDSKTTCALPKGLYATQVRRLVGEAETTDGEIEALRQIGTVDVEYHDRLIRNGFLIGIAVLLLVTVTLLFVARWYVALPTGLIAFVAYFHVLQRVLNRNRRFQNVADRVFAARHATEPPILVVQFTRRDG